MATNAQRLAEAEEALHRLLTGRSVEEVVVTDYGRTRYTPADAAALREYLGTLRAAETAGVSVTRVTTSKGLI